MQDKDIRTLGYVMRRTNYGEADRILNVITPLGKIAAIAKGVRKEKSKLAGGVEIFTLSEFTFHRGRGDLFTVTSAKMKKHLSGIIKDLNKLELGGMILKRINNAADNSDSPELFNLTDQCLRGLNDGASLELIQGWFLLNLVKEMGEEINLLRDSDGNKLLESERYDWNTTESCFAVRENGVYGPNEIKMLRLMLSSPLDVVRRVKCSDEMLVIVLQFAKIVARL